LNDKKKQRREKGKEKRIIKRHTHIHINLYIFSGGLLFFLISFLLEGEEFRQLPADRLVEVRDGRVVQLSHFRLVVAEPRFHPAHPANRPTRRRLLDRTFGFGRNVH
jgi:hypothetical protein